MKTTPGLFPMTSTPHSSIPVNAAAVSFLSRALRGAAALILISACAVASAAERQVEIKLPKKISAKSPVTIAVSATTDFGEGEQIGFLHAEYSTDGGKTWKRITYATNAGAKTEHGATFDAGAAGSKIVVRVRTAFRGGKAGDVDSDGKPIQWNATWNTWAEPPAKFVTVTVVE